MAVKQRVLLPVYHDVIHHFDEPRTPGTGTSFVVNTYRDGVLSLSFERLFLVSNLRFHL